MKKMIIVLVISLVMLCACEKENQNVVISTENIMEAEFTRNDSVWDNFEISDCTLSVPEIFAGSFFVFENKVYYEVNYQDLLVDQTGLTGNVPFDSKYNTEIREHDMNTGLERIIYQYDADRCIDIYSIVCNGNDLAWVEATNQGWEIQAMRPLESNRPYTLANGQECGGDFIDIMLNITEEKLYWYNQEGNENNCITLYVYDFSTGEINIARDGLDLVSPYETVCILNDGITVYSKNAINGYKIVTNEMETGEGTVLDVNMDVSHPICNESYCIWTQGYGGGRDEVLYIYGFKDGKTEMIDVSPGYIFSYALIDGCIFINQRKASEFGEEGLYCFDMEKGEYGTLTTSKESILLYTKQTFRDNMFFELANPSEAHHIINIMQNSSRQ